MSKANNLTCQCVTTSVEATHSDESLRFRRTFEIWNRLDLPIFMVWPATEAEEKGHRREANHAIDCSPPQQHRLPSGKSQATIKDDYDAFQAEYHGNTSLVRFNLMARCFGVLTMHTTSGNTPYFRIQHLLV